MENSTKNVLIAAGAGAVVGAVLGVLFAPAKGSETRAAIGSKAKDLKDKFTSENGVTDMIASLKQSVEKSLSNGKSEVKDELLDQIKELEKSMK